MLCLKIAGWQANNVDPDETPHSAASHLGLHCLLRPVYPNTYVYCIAQVSLTISAVLLTGVTIKHLND